MTKIPQTITEAVDQLNGVGALLTAKEWERAAVVYAFTRDGVAGEYGRGGDRRSGSTTSNALTPREFAALGITGLKSDQTVRGYRRNWQTAIDAGEAKPVAPGDDIELPDMPWPPTGHSHGIADKIRKDATPDEKAEVVRQALSEPEVVAAVINDPEARHTVRQALDQRYEDAPKPHPVEPARPRPIDLVTQFRDLHVRVERIVQTVINGGVIVGDAERDALLEEVGWLRAALDHTESGIRAGSLDEALRAFQEEWL